MELRGDARNSSNDKLFRVHHARSRDLGAVTVHFLLSTQISPVNCERGSEEGEALLLPGTAGVWPFFSPRAHRGVSGLVQTHFHIHPRLHPLNCSPMWKRWHVAHRRGNPAAPGLAELSQRSVARLWEVILPLYYSCETPPGILEPAAPLAWPILLFNKSIKLLGISADLIPSRPISLLNSNSPKY